MKNHTWSKRWAAIAVLLFALPLISLVTHHATTQSAHAQLAGGYRLSSLSYLRKVVFLINRHYVERKQIAPAKMFREALKRIQLLVPSVMIKMDKNNKKVDIYVDKKHKAFKLKGFPIVFSVPFQLRPIFAFIEKHYRGDVKLRKIEFAAIHGVLSTLDQHTSFLPPSYYQEMNFHTEGKFGGLGIVIQNKDGFLTVLSPMPGTPASRVGLKPMDRIVRIGDESTINMTLNEAVSKLRGKPGSKVVIWIQRKGLPKPKRVEIIRAIIRVKSVTSHLLPKKVGYIRIKQFQKTTSRNVRKALKAFHAETKGLKGLILDLRSNPGGLLNQAIAVSDIFLKKGTIVSHAGGSSQREEHKASSLGTEPDYPIIVLVNRGSASASEIVSGALKNHNRALILGQQTHGKGTVQVLFPMSPPRYFSRGERSALKLTVAQYLTPGGISIQKIGITPDIAIHAVYITKDLVHFFDSVEQRKLKNKKLPRFLRGIREHRRPLYRLSFLDQRSDKERASQYREDYNNKQKFKPDFEVSLASKLLLATKASERKAFYRSIRASLNKIRTRENKRINKTLKKYGINWKKQKKRTKKMARLSIRTQLLPLPPAKGKKGKKSEKRRSPKGKNVWAGSGFRLKVTIRNKGTATAYRVRAVSNADYWFLNRKEFVFGKIRPKQTKTWFVNFEIPKWVKPQVQKLSINVSSSDKRIKSKKDLLLKINGYKRPRFDFSYALEERKGNGDGLIQPGEQFALRVSVRNQGAGHSFPVTGLLRNKTGRELFIKTGRIRFGAIKKGQHATGWFYFNIHPHTSKRTIEMQLSIFDTKLHTTAKQRLSIRVHASELSKNKLSGRWLKVKERWAWVYGGAAMDAPRIARVAKGSVLKITGRLGPFVEVSLPKKLWGTVKQKPRKGHKPAWRGWIPSRDVTYLNKKGKSKKPTMRLYWQAVTPQIAIKQADKPLIVTKPTFLLQGNVRNNVSLLDVYVLVNNEKVFYRALRNVPKVGLRLPIKLKKGQNRILIVARESVQFSGYKEINIFYKK
jgi:carboxyl-terminal processing protease